MYRFITKLKILGFAVILILSACKHKPGWGETSVLYDGVTPVSFFVPVDILDFPSSEERLNTRLSINGAGTAIPITSTLDNYGLKITPKQSIQFGATYQIEVDGRAVANIKVSEINSKSPSVLKIYPSADTLPSNLARLIITFDEPMAQGNWSKFTNLKESGTGRDLSSALTGGQWNSDKTRLILALSKPSKLESGKRYNLTISKEWLSTSNKKLPKDISKEFYVNGPDINPPSTSNWRLAAPFVGSRQAVIIEIREMMDQSTLIESISIIRRDGSKIPGNLFIGNKESRVLFYPTQIWEAGIYYVKIAPGINDLAGNSLGLSQAKDSVSRADNEQQPHTLQFVINL